jgi:Domain of unknown function (DUF1906)/LysM domain
VSHHKVLDYSYARFSPAQLHAKGAEAVGRYLTVVNSTTKGKLLTRAEAEGLSAAGIAMVSVFEFDRHDAVGGYQRGKEYAAVAHEQHAAAGGPAGRPVYFGVDFDADDYAPNLPNTPASARAKLGPIAEYFHGINDAAGGAHLTGCYGGFWVIKRLFEAGLIGWGWQTVAWSGGQVHPRIAMLQNQFTGSYDVNQAEVDDYGQWRIGWEPGDAATAAVVPSIPATGVWHKVKPGDTLAALARAYGTTVAAIQALNPGLITDVNAISVGWSIQVK